MNQLKSKNILVTGGAGFIGSNLCEYLLDHGAKVTCLDNFSTGYKNNIKQFLNNPNFKLIEGDIREYNDCLKSTNNVEYVLHQALNPIHNFYPRPKIRASNSNIHYIGFGFKCFP